MSTKRKGVLTLDGAWQKHLRPWLKRKFWKRERAAGKDLGRREAQQSRSETDAHR